MDEFEEERDEQAPAEESGEVVVSSDEAEPDEVGQAANSDRGDGNPILSMMRRIASGRAVGLLISHKWISLAALFGLFFVVMGLHISLGPKEVDDQEPASQYVATKKMLKEESGEENLKPFFIPLPEGSSKTVIRIDLSANWDRSVSTRFKTKELQIRDHLYRYLLELAKSGDDLQKKLFSLEADISGIVKNFMGKMDLTIRIVEIEYI